MSRDFPALAAPHIAGAKLYATRGDLIDDLPIAQGSVIAELGVALGTFSKYMIASLKPSCFHAFDLFALHTNEYLWGQRTAELMGGMTHAAFYRAEMAASGTPVIVHEGPSQQTLPKCADDFFDMIYVDAEHTYDEIKADAAIAERKVKKDGILVFNDYIMYDPFVKADYGIVPVVNEMVVHRGWRVVGFALQKHMFCDIAIRRE